MIIQNLLVMNMEQVRFKHSKYNVNLYLKRLSSLNFYHYQYSQLGNLQYKCAHLKSMKYFLVIRKLVLSKNMP